ncbi:hypothetical protein Goshw_017814 [Gossypium schwendimanii]|uniref:DUF4283 domain-containing protein n=1 Tax=Gossypium schwendimanii TaxID=34291 RepID=A0A7J9MNX0_GOSSC|nr:hypothetical protein [Gossypium schwendimanii]
MRSTMANLWHLVKGVKISDLGEKRFLFKFFHKMDLDRVLKGSPWTFNNHLLMLHRLEKEEAPLKSDVKKRPRREGDKVVDVKELRSLVLRSRRGLRGNHIISTIARGQADQLQ